ncbi:hypothetical protein FACS1894206_09410 [Deltaproteobacteria bacterium]|nr:hypothetical protein FACS1894206_09410 [Deltaproteobacteria bacterium]
MTQPIQAPPTQAAHQAQAAQADIPAQAAQAAAEPQQALPNPADVLDAARQRFPTVDVNILQGKKAPTTRSAEQQIAAANQLAAPPRRDVVPILAGQSEHSRVSLMPTAGVRGPDKAAVIQSYINDGKTIYNNIMRGDYAAVPQADKHDVAKLMWFLQALASGKAAESSGARSGPALFREGAMFVEDPQGLLEAFLTSANSYARSSSHLHAYQSMGREYHPHGVDLRNVETPNQRKTVLFARMPDGDGPADGPRGTGDKRMLFVKMEPHGCRGLTPRGSGTPPGDHVTPGSVWKGVKRFFLNAKDSFMHGTGFVKSMFQRIGFIAVDGQNNRERIPGEIKNDYKRLIDGAETLRLGALLAALTARQPLSDAGGIKQMLSNLERSLRPDMDNAGLRGAMIDLRDRLRSHGDHLDLRIGNEVILTQDEMNIGTANPIRAFTPESAPVTSRNERSGAALEQARLGREYILADLAGRADGVDQFDKDVLRDTYSIGGARFEADTNTAQTGEALAELRAEHIRQTHAAILALTVDAQGNTNPGVASAIMSLCHQGLTKDISQVQADTLANFGVMINLSDRAIYSAERRDDTAEGNQVYRLSYSLDKELATASSTVVGTVALDRAQSHITASVILDLQVTPDGRMSLSYPEAPGYELHLTPTGQ